MQPTSSAAAAYIRQLVSEAHALFDTGQFPSASETIRHIPELQMQLQTYPTGDPHRDAVRIRRAIVDAYELCFRAMGLTHLPCEPFSDRYCELIRQHIEAWRQEQAVYARKFGN